MKRITINPQISHGKPVIRGLRYLVESILEYLAGGDTIEDILVEFKDLDPQEAIDNNTTGVVIIHFIVEIDGKINEVKIKRDIGDGCGRRYDHLEFNCP